jgi:hypothetical protein
MERTTESITASRMAALAHVTRQLLDPLQVNDRHHADQQIHVARHVVLRRDHAAVQSFVKQDVGGSGSGCQG